MNNLGKQLLKMGNFPIERDKNLEKLLNQMKHGKIWTTVSSFEEIYNQTPVGKPFPIGCINFEDGKNRFVVSWRDDFSKLKINNIEEYSLKVRHYATEEYPVLSMMVGIHSGKIDPDSKEDLWYHGDCHLDMAFLLTRIKMYQLLNCEEILFCLFDGDSDNLDSFGFTLNKDELVEIEGEILSLLSISDNMEFINHLKDFSEASEKVDNGFNANGLPKSQDALGIYLKRKSLTPKPSKHNWKEYLSI